MAARGAHHTASDQPPKHHAWRRLEPMEAAYARIVAALSAYKPERIYLFGSHARGEADSLSDVDIIVVKRTTQPFLERLREVRRFLPPELGNLDVLVYTPDELAEMQRRGNAFSELILEEAKLIYGG